MTEQQGNEDVATPYGPREAVADWLRANAVDPNDVPINGPITIERDPLEGRSIRYASMVRSDDGDILRDPRVDGPKTEERTAPLKVEPPTNVQVMDWK
ncbi:hypothetical protein [Streptomyces sp. UG1]|uniref:hypothetical protein n=1 Tax=Streptomyces sp. UG1 TaxID=3417652 RepID=UPI003CEB03ED